LSKLYQYNILKTVTTFRESIVWVI